VRTDGFENEIEIEAIEIRDSYSWQIGGRNEENYS
jgi:hypothetical protein